MAKYAYPLPEGRGDCIIRELTLAQKEGLGVAALNLTKGNTLKAAPIEERLSLQSCLVQFGDQAFANAIETEAAWESGKLTILDKQFIQMAYADIHEVTVGEAVALLASKQPDPDNPGQFRYLFPDWDRLLDVPEDQTTEEAREEARDKNWLVMRVLGVKEAEEIADRSTGKGNVFSAVLEEERRLVQAATVSIKGAKLEPEDWKLVKVKQRKLISIGYAKLHTVTEAEEASFFGGKRVIP